MSTATGDYSISPVVVSPVALAELRANFVAYAPRVPSAVDIAGKCPRCKHFVHYVLRKPEFAESVVLTCNCAETHSDGKRGCGAWFAVRGSFDGPKIRLTPGPAEISLLEIDNAQARDALAASELDRVRATASNWKTGLAALFALIPTLIVVKGTDAVDQLATTDKIIVGALVAVGAGLALAATIIALRAACGSFRRSRACDDLTVAREREVARTLRDLQITKVMAIVAVAALAAAIGYTWAAPQAPTPAYFSVGLPSGMVVCGKLVSSDPGSVRVQTANGETLAFSLADVTSTTFVASC